MPNTLDCGLISPSKKTPPPTRKSGRGCQTRHNISHQILGTALNPKSTRASVRSRPFRHAGYLGRTDLLFLSTKGRKRGLQFLLLLRVDRRVSEIKFLDRFHNGRGDKKSGKPFVISWHHVPRCAVGRRSPNCFLECLHVVAPKLALLNVRGREFPVFVWSVEALHEALLLLLARQVQEELENDRPLPREIILEVRDVAEPFAPNALA